MLSCISGGVFHSGRVSGWIDGSRKESSTSWDRRFVEQGWVLDNGRRAMEQSRRQRVSPWRQRRAKQSHDMHLIPLDTTAQRLCDHNHESRYLFSEIRSRILVVMTWTGEGSIKTVLVHDENTSARQSHRAK